MYETSFLPWSSEKIQQQPGQVTHCIKKVIFLTASSVFYGETNEKDIPVTAIQTR